MYCVYMCLDKFGAFLEVCYKDVLYFHYLYGITMEVLQKG